MCVRNVRKPSTPVKIEHAVLFLIIQPTHIEFVTVGFDLCAFSRLSLCLLSLR